MPKFRPQRPLVDSGKEVGADVGVEEVGDVAEGEREGVLGGGLEADAEVDVAGGGAGELDGGAGELDGGAGELDGGAGELDGGAGPQRCIVSLPFIKLTQLPTPNAA